MEGRVRMGWDEREWGEGEGRERKEGREGIGRRKGRAGGALPQIKIYDYTPAYKHESIFTAIGCAVHVDALKKTGGDDHVNK